MRLTVRTLLAWLDHMLPSDVQHELSDKVAALLTMRYLEMVKALNTVSGAKPEDWKRIRELCSDLVALRKGDHSAERAKLERRRC